MRHNNSSSNRQPQRQPIRAKKSLGQNFLHSQKALHQIIKAADLQIDETVVEIGPGKGALTHELLKAGCKVIAIELDNRLIPYLQKAFKPALITERLILIHGDALHTDFSEYLDNPNTSQAISETRVKRDLQTPESGSEYFKVVANIPYYITSPLITRLLLEQYEINQLPQKIVLLTQKEVAEKICDPEYDSVISLSVKLFGTPKLVATVPASAFSPAPNVDSAIIEISDIKAPDKELNCRQLIKLIKQGFKAPRKKIMNNLLATLRLEKEEAQKRLENAGIDPNLRPEKLNIEDWKTILPHFEDRL